MGESENILPGWLRPLIVVRLLLEVLMDDTQRSRRLPRRRWSPCGMPTCHVPPLSRCWDALLPVYLLPTLLLCHLLPWGRGLAAVAYGQTEPPPRPAAVRCP